MDMSPENLSQDTAPLQSDEHAHRRLTRLREKGLLRSLRALPSSGGKIRLQDRDVLNFSSNDYLDLANDERLKQGAMRAIEDFGCGATASRLMAGHLDIHARLEERLARFIGKEAALVFPTGFQTNIGVLTSLGDAQSHIFSDELNHASIVDGCRLAKADVSIYRHNDVDHLEELLSEKRYDSQPIIVTDSIFSMDGDQAPLVALAELAQRYDALFVVDEAHAIGVYGKGAGLCAELGVEADAVVGTLSKALGGEGGFVATSRGIRDLIINEARSFIYSTGLAPACAGSALAALDVLEDMPRIGGELLERSDFFRDELRKAGLNVPPDRSQIVPILIGENEKSVELSRKLLDHGILAAAVRPPTVPEGTARLRFSLTLAHEKGDLVAAAGRIARVCKGNFAG